MSELRPLNFCCTCGEDFSSLTGFDRHRVGKHEYLYDPWDDSKLDGRRCLTTDEMLKKGWARDRNGRWQVPRSGTERERLSALKGSTSRGLNPPGRRAA
jgi:hypothetical protein